MENDFYKALEERKLLDILKYVEYRPPLFRGFSKVRDLLNEIAFKPNSKILVYGDYDVDGLMFTMVTRVFLDALGCNNYEIFPYWKRTHELDGEAIRYCIQNNFDYFIIGDTGSNALSSLESITQYGTKVLCIDHHVCNYVYDDYPDDIAVLSSNIENSLEGFTKYKYSAAAFAYVIYDFFAKENSIDYAKNASAYALVSLYSDCMDMSNEYNRAIYYYARQLDNEELPNYIRHFLNDYQSFNSRFIEYWYAPRINSLFRNEEFDLINRYFFDDTLNSVEKSQLIATINEHYKTNRDFTNRLVDLVDVSELDNFVFADLGTAVNKDKTLARRTYNYTGLVANKLSERYYKTAIVICSTDSYYKGSVRDLYGKNYLNIFQHICYAAGHNAAFGLKINFLDLDYFLERVARVDERYSITGIPNEPLIVKHEYAMPDNALIEDIALYNEFSGNEIPVAYLYKQLIGNMRESQNSYYYSYSWGDYFVQSDYHIDFGTKMIIKPIKSGRTKLLYQG